MEGEATVTGLLKRALAHVKVSRQDLCDSEKIGSYFQIIGPAEKAPEEETCLTHYSPVLPHFLLGLLLAKANQNSETKVLAI